MHMAVVHHPEDIVLPTATRPSIITMIYSDQTARDDALIKLRTYLRTNYPDFRASPLLTTVEASNKDTVYKQLLSKPNLDLRDWGTRVAVFETKADFSIERHLLHLSTPPS